MIAFLGMGRLGANFVRARRRRETAVNVWNRSPEKARELETVGARAFDDPAEAVRGAVRIHLALSDDTAVDAVLERASGAIGEHCIIVDHTTTAPAPTLARVHHWAARGIRYQHAPVFMGPSNALDGSGTMLLSGDHALFDALAPALGPMTGKLVYLGEDASRAASIKLIGNLFLLGMTASLADMFALGDSLGIPATDAAQIFDWFNPVAMAPARATRMRGGDLADASWTLAMARKDARLMMETAEQHGGQLAVIPAIAVEMDRWLAAGHERDDYMIIGSGARGPMSPGAK